MRQKSAPSERSEETERSPFCSLSLSRKTPVAFRPASFESKEQKERERGKLTLGKMGSLISFSLSLFLTRSLDEKGERRNKRTVFSLRSKGDKKLFFTVSLFSRRPASFENKRKKNSLTHSLLLFSLPSLPPPPLPPPPPSGQRLPGHQAPRLLELGLLRLPSRVRLRHARPRVRRAERRRRRRVRAAAAGDDRAVGLEAARMHGEDLQPLHRGGVLPGVERVQDGGGDGPQGRIRAAVWRRPEPEGGDGRQGDEGLIFLFFLFFFFFFFPFLFCSGLGERYGGRERERGGGEIWRIMTTRKEKT